MKRLSFIFFVISAISGSLLAQTSPPNIIGQDDERRVITTAVPFLSITPDARSGGMGDAGAGISADANSIHWNPAKLAFLERINMSFSLFPCHAWTTTTI